MSEGAAVDYTGEIRRQPIGYWIKRTGEVLNHTIDERLRDAGVSRQHWLVLCLVREAPAGATRDQLHSSLRSLSDEQLDEIISDLCARGWLAPEVDPRSGVVRQTLTEIGRAGQLKLALVISGVRRQSLEGISEDDYAFMIECLKRMITNLGVEPGQGPSSNHRSKPART
ncbi:MarR family winged helix-turn-helix transcriptional regulator [Allokutzneria oryzae]|uniref:MarR family winged helix-turn-helix transcriptional regulator n=1 Tax=Allokutzneria oryzae TaxID=1378989 RepID=A0ABV6A4J0_9PSEU